MALSSATMAFDAARNSKKVEKLNLLIQSFSLLPAVATVFFPGKNGPFPCRNRWRQGQLATLGPFQPESAIWPTKRQSTKLENCRLLRLIVYLFFESFLMWFAGMSGQNGHCQGQLAARCGACEKAIHRNFRYQILNEYPTHEHFLVKTNTQLIVSIVY
jgi:hypothetical protein